MCDREQRYRSFTIVRGESETQHRILHSMRLQATYEPTSPISDIPRVFPTDIERHYPRIGYCMNRRISVWYDNITNELEMEIARSSISI